MDVNFNNNNNNIYFAQKVQSSNNTRYKYHNMCMITTIGVINK